MTLENAAVSPVEVLGVSLPFHLWRAATAPSARALFSAPPEAAKRVAAALAERDVEAPGDAIVSAVQALPFGTRLGGTRNGFAAFAQRPDANMDCDDPAYLAAARIQALPAEKRRIRFGGDIAAIRDAGVLVVQRYARALLPIALDAGVARTGLPTQVTQQHVWVPLEMTRPRAHRGAGQRSGPMKNGDVDEEIIPWRLDPAGDSLLDDGVSLVSMRGALRRAPGPSATTAAERSGEALRDR